MKKLTYEQIKEIKKLKESGMSIIDLSKKFNISPSVIRYHTINSVKEERRNYRKEWYRKLSKEKKKLIYSKNKEYSREYHKRKYKEDPEFRQRQIEATKRSKLKRKEK